jgi:hypothetical protein
VCACIFISIFCCFSSAAGLKTVVYYLVWHYCRQAAHAGISISSALLFKKLFPLDFLISLFCLVVFQQTVWLIPPRNYVTSSRLYITSRPGPAMDNKSFFLFLIERRVSWLGQKPNDQTGRWVRMAKNSLSIKRREGGGGRKCVQRTDGRADGRTGEKGNIRRPKHIRETTKNKYNKKRGGGGDGRCPCVRGFTGIIDPVGPVRGSSGGGQQIQ